MDIMHKLAKGLDHGRWKAIGVVVALLAGAWLMGCQSRTQSVLTEGQKVTRLQLQAEADTIAARLTAGVADLDRQDALRAKITTVASGLAMAGVEGTLNPATGIAALMNLAVLGVGGGAILDNRRKNAVIASLKTT